MCWKTLRKAESMMPSMRPRVLPSRKECDRARDQLNALSLESPFLRVAVLSLSAPTKRSKSSSVISANGKCITSPRYREKIRSAGKTGCSCKNGQFVRSNTQFILKESAVND